MSTRSTTPLLLALAGPALVGACLGLVVGPEAVLARAAALPAIILGVACLMLPALYIGTAIAGAAPAARDVLRAGSTALSAGGVVMLGLAPALAFLLATTTGSVTPALLAHLVIALAMGLALSVLHRDLFAGAGLAVRARLVFAGWALVALGLGERFLLSTLTA